MHGYRGRATHELGVAGRPAAGDASLPAFLAAAALDFLVKFAICTNMVLNMRRIGDGRLYSFLEGWSE